MSKSAVLVIVASLGLAGCSAGTDLEESLLVSAASSLTDAFIEIEIEFELANPGVDVVVNLAGSSTLREQIFQGAPVDVFASADMANMGHLWRTGELAGQPRIFATNVMEIAVPLGNPAGVSGLEDFERVELLIGLCAREVPCGDLAHAVLEMAGITPATDTEEPDVRALLTKIQFGELDAGIVYRSDVVASGGAVVGITLPDRSNVTAEYPIAVVAGTLKPESARRFVEFVLSPAGQSILSRHGFGPP